MSQTKRQRDRVREYLERGKRITQRQASKWFGIDRLAARIGELKGEGVAIHADFKKVKTRYGHTHVAQYSIQA